MFALVLYMLMTLSSANSAVEPQEHFNTFDSIIVVKIEGITAQQYQSIQDLVDSRENLQVEYGCLWSGVMVFKLYKSSLQDVGDVHLYIKSLVQQVSPLPRMEVMHVHTGVSGTAKC